MICPNCGTEIPDGSKFCLNCGKPVGQAALTNETKSDVVNSQRTEAQTTPVNQTTSSPENGESEPTTPITPQDETIVNPEENTTKKVNTRDATPNHEESKDSNPNLVPPQDDAGTTSESSDNNGKRPTWLIVLLSIILPPVGIFLIWRWRKDEGTPKKALLTAILCFLTVCYASGINTSAQSIEREKERSQAISALSNLNATYEANGVRFHYPSSWGVQGGGAEANYPGTNKKIGFIMYTSTYDHETYNLSYRYGFDQWTEAVIKSFSSSGYEVDSDSAETQVLSNAMTKTVKVSGPSNAGVMIIYSDSSGNANQLFTYVDKDVASSEPESMDIVNNIVSSVEFTAPDYDIDPTQAPLTSIESSYSGSTEEGTSIDDSNGGITVTGSYGDGSTKTLGATEWSVQNPQTLQAGKATTVTIVAGSVTTELTVQCTTVTEEQYKQSCQDISYDELLRNPDNYKGMDIRLRGKIFQSVSGMILANVTQGSYGLWDDVTMIYWNGEPNIIEDDIVTVWGTYSGTYTYTTALGAQKTVPLLVAKYVTVE